MVVRFFDLNKSIFTKLERLQYRAIRIAMDYHISTPINIMLFGAKEVPLKLRLTLLICKFLTKSLPGNLILLLKA